MTVINFLAATKHLWEHFCPSVRPSFCLPVTPLFTRFSSLCLHDIFRSYYHWYPYIRSRSVVKCQGHRGQNKCCPNMGVSALWLQFEFTDSREIIHKACSSIEDLSAFLFHFFSTILTLIERFPAVTPVWIHRWLRNNAQILMWHRRGAVLFFERYSSLVSSPFNQRWLAQAVTV